MNALTYFALKDIELNSYDTEKYFLEKSRDDKYIIKLRNMDKEFYIGSKYSVERDIQNFINQIDDFNVNTIFIVFGLGSGEHIQELINKISSSNKIIVIEPDTNIIAAFCSLTNSNKILTDNRVVISALQPDKVQSILGSFIEEFNLNNVKVMTFANYDKIYGTENIEFIKVIKEFLETRAINIKTNLIFSQQFFKCLVKNLKHIIESTTLNEFHNKFKNIPAVVVSAGPSLEKNIELLKEVKDEFVIISGGRTVKPIRRVGIEPDFVAVIDPGEPSYNVIADSLDCTAPLVFCDVTNYDVVNEYKGEKIFFQEGCSLGKITPEFIGLKVDNLFQGGSVAHTCTSFAKYIGCDPIIFIGQDLAYTNNKLHAEIASIEENNTYNENTILVEDVYGGQVPTDMLFNAYRKHLEQFINISKDVTFINSTEGGANISGTVVMDFREAIDKYKQQEKFNKGIFDILGNTKKFDREFVIKALETLLIDMNDIKKDCKKAISNADNVLTAYNCGMKYDMNSLLKNVKKINGRIDKINFLDNLLKPTIFKFLMHPDYMDKLGEPQAERERRLARQTKNLYQDIIIAIDEAIPLIEQSLSEIKG